MARDPIIAIADDLTGAAEIAAMGHRHGLAAVVATGATISTRDVDLIAFDTDSRLDPPDVAAKKIADLARAIAPLPRSMLFKKTDSVLRGAVRAEVESLAAALGFSRIVLAPANPTLGRTIRDGRYTIAGVPLHETTFAHDPHHPARTDSVRGLLGDHGTLAVSTLNATDPLPEAGIIVGNAATSADPLAWARQISPNTLPAGGGEFFSALLTQRGFARAAAASTFSPGGPVLIVSGTASAAGEIVRAAARRDRVPIVPMPVAALSDLSAAHRWADALQTQLATANHALAVFDGPKSSDPKIATAIRATFANALRILVERRALRHLVVEGGSTAATIMHALGWRELRVVHEWAHGVGSLRAPGDFPITVTVKPGSYALPDSLWQHVLQPHAPLAPSRS